LKLFDNVIAVRFSLRHSVGLYTVYHCFSGLWSQPPVRFPGTWRHTLLRVLVPIPSQNPPTMTDCLPSLTAYKLAA